MTRKYRPYFTLAELSRIRDVLSTAEPTSALSRYISRYILDIESGFRSANHTSAPSLEHKLGFAEPEAPTTHESTQQYRYENDLMSPQEEYEYEKCN